MPAFVAPPKGLGFVPPATGGVAAGVVDDRLPNRLVFGAAGVVDPNSDGAAGLSVEVVNDEEFG